jgi:hypothetical protein
MLAMNAHSDSETLQEAAESGIGRAFMTTLDKVRGIFVVGVRSLRRRRRRKVPVEGVPEGIAFETLDELCLQQLGQPLAHVSHLHLSGWKAAGSYRLLLRTRGGRHWSLIYKDAIYNLDHIPALAKLPITPGPPEFLIYGNARGALAKYLPAVYLCSEITPGEHYQYLLEDLGQEYQRNTSPEVILSTVAELRAVHRALSEWSPTVDEDCLLRYGYEFSVAVQEYARTTLERYAQRTASATVSELCELWPQVSAVYLRKEFHGFTTARPIHGDLNPANVRIHRKYPDRIKLIDWEWAGLGMAHADLVSLVGGRAPEVRQQALAVFSRQDNRLSLDEHRRLYQWCRLERALLNAAFCAAQLMGLPASTTRLDLSRVVERATGHVLRVYQELA